MSSFCCQQLQPAKLALLGMGMSLDAGVIGSLGRGSLMWTCLRHEVILEGVCSTDQQAAVFKQSAGTVLPAVGYL